VTPAASLPRPCGAGESRLSNGALNNYGSTNLAIVRRMAIDILEHHLDNIFTARKMNKAAWSNDYMFSLFTPMR
jgi:hypothetical protein